MIYALLNSKTKISQIVAVSACSPIEQEKIWAWDLAKFVAI
jgi:hypothetical protein